LDEDRSDWNWAGDVISTSFDMLARELVCDVDLVEVVDWSYPRKQFYGGASNPWPGINWTRDGLI
jgi:hypothetical protein